MKFRGSGWSWKAVALCAIVIAQGTVRAQADTEFFPPPADSADEMVGVPVGRPWESFIELPGTPPSGVPEQAVGFYSKGSLVNPDSFPLETADLLKILRPRNRAWATTDLVRLVTSTAAATRARYPGSERVQIGDVANHDGGSIGSHDSHQNGLDADLVYFRVSRLEQDPEHNDDFEESFVSDGRVTSDFDFERNWDFLTRLVSSERINRIFVDVAIKRAMCLRHSEELGATEVLRRLRPWPLHDNHMHVRITCPRTSPRCVAQDEPPPGSSCAELVIH